MVEHKTEARKNSPIKGKGKGSPRNKYNNNNMNDKNRGRQGKQGGKGGQQQGRAGEALLGAKRRAGNAIISVVIHLR